MSLREYLDQIRDAPDDSSLLLELNALSAKSRISLKEQLQADIDRAMTDIALKQCDITKKAISKVYEMTYYRTAYDVQRGTGFAFNLAKLDHAVIEKVITYPWSTKVFSRAIWDNLDKMTATLKKTLAEGFAKGASVQRMAKVLNDEFKSGRYAAERVIRTESKHFHMQSQADSFKELGYEEYVYHKNGSCARTRKGVKICDCVLLDKKTFKLEDIEPGINIPPIHPNCKCYITAKRKINMFEKREGITPLHENVKYQQWKNTYVK
ncbi:minor capsid protein [[Clostridium] innocuum]|nr:minor capsid protein [[Clostridium] innocuum]